jgi:HKD family nuclease
MKIILNDHRGSATFADALKELVVGADTLSVAVSYLQVSGWQMFQAQTRGLSLPDMRIVCTDQLGITQPAAVSRAIASGVQIRNYAERVTYHPKVYLAHDKTGRPTRFLLGSANLSVSAFTNSVEAGVLSEDRAGLVTLKDWFDDLFKKRSEEFTTESLRQMEIKWRKAAVARAQSHLRMRRESIVPARAVEASINAEDLDTLEDVFATVQPPIGVLCMDYAGNTVRNINRVRELLKNWPQLSQASGNTPKKQRSELKNLGFVDDAKLTSLGEAAVKATSDSEVARLWCAWLHKVPNTRLAVIRPELLTAKRVFSQFWRLQPEVQRFFLENAQGSKSDTPLRLVLNTIELLCSANAVVQELSLDDFKTIAPLLSQPERIPITVRKDVVHYFNPEKGKGYRTWENPDRRLIPLAWKEVAG